MTDPVCPENVKGSDAELLPCPFCGAIPATSNGPYESVIVICRTRGCAGATTWVVLPEWNKRTIPSVGEEQKEWTINEVSKGAEIVDSDGLGIVICQSTKFALKIIGAHSQSVAALRAEIERLRKVNGIAQYAIGSALEHLQQDGLIADHGEVKERLKAALSALPSSKFPSGQVTSTTESK